MEYQWQNRQKDPGITDPDHRSMKGMYYGKVLRWQLVAVEILLRCLMLGIMLAVYQYRTDSGNGLLLLHMKMNG